MKKAIDVVIMSLVAVLIALSPAFPTFGAALTSSAPEDSSERAQDANAVSADRPAQESALVVGKIGEYVITKDELKQRVLNEIRPSGDAYNGQDEPVTVEGVLLEMIAEKAMIMEGRKLGYLNDAMIHSYIERQRERKLVGLLLTDYLRENVSVADAEIDQKMEANAKLTREQAKATVQREKATKVLGQFYGQLLEKFHLEKVKESFPRASQIHQRLLYRPAEPRKEGWIRNSQVRTELSEDEGNIVLATYDGGRFTLKDWFESLCEIVPPRRPRDLHTPAGVEKLLDSALRPAILVAEAKARGYHTNEKLLQEIRELEDRSVLGKAQSEKVKDFNEPTEEQIKAYFEKNKERFAESASLKVDQIWCEDLPTARKVKELLDGPADFESVKSTYSLNKESQPHGLYPSGEGLFWDELWKAEPNEVTGPVRGFHGSGVKWRVAKILEKTPPKLQVYSDNLQGRVKGAMRSERRRSILNSYRKELLEKYPYELYAQRIKDIDPLEVATTEKTPK